MMAKKDAKNIEVRVQLYIKECKMSIIDEWWHQVNENFTVLFISIYTLLPSLFLIISHPFCLTNLWAMLYNYIHLFLRSGIIFTADNPSMLRIVALTSLDLFWLPSSALVWIRQLFFMQYGNLKTKKKTLKATRKTKKNTIKYIIIIIMKSEESLQLAKTG